MARGDSGRIVLEIDPSLKDELYSALTRDGHTLKSWFLANTEKYLLERNQLQLFRPALVAEEPAEYKASGKKNGGRNSDKKNK
ncbi:MAG: hypothetical protein H7A51_07890 [Akkermansiaceae bacterium]|nr:hypothetical protein [Akkermansiaceae bacterium]